MLSITGSCSYDGLLQIFSERLLSVRSEMQEKALTMPRGAARAGQSIDSDILTKENAVLCQAIEDTFLAVDEKIKTPESREALVKIFMDVRINQYQGECCILMLTAFCREKGGGRSMMYTLAV